MSRRDARERVRPPRFTGRRTPYTERGIRRVPCARCGLPSVHQWSTCANGNRWVAVCEACDLALNAIGLRFFRIPNRDALLAWYRRTMRRGD